MENYTFNKEEGIPSSDRENTSPMSSVSFIKPLPSILDSGLPAISTSSRKSLRFKLTVFFLCLISVIAAMDAVIVGACLSAISTSLNSTSAQSFWVGTSFLLAQTVTIPIYGTTGEIFGRKWAIITGITLFLLGSILCATAQNIDWLISARVIQGIGAGGITQLVQVILSDITTMEERGLYISMSMASWAFGTNIGIPIGGVIGTFTSWRWVFYINIPFCVTSIIGLCYSLNLKQDTSSLRNKLARVDYLGLGLFISGATLFLAGVTSGGVAAPWTSAKVLAPMIVGATLCVAFICVEWKVAKEPVIPLRIFNDRTAITGYSTSFLHGMVMWCFIYYFIVFFLGATQHTLLNSALETMSVSGPIAPAAIISSLVVKRTLRFKYIIIIGWILLGVGVVANVTMHPNSSKAILYAPRLISAFGAGLLMPTPLFAVQANQRDTDVGAATSVQVFMRSLGMTCGVAIGGVVFQNRWAQLLPNLLKGVAKGFWIESQYAEVGYGLVKKMPEPVQAIYKELYSESLDTVWWVMGALSLVGLLGALVAKDDVLRRVGVGKQAFEDDSGDEKRQIDIEASGADWHELK